MPTYFLSAGIDSAELVDWSRLVVEATPNAILMIDERRRVVLVNKKAEELFGYARSELLGMLVEELVPDRHRLVHPEHVAGFFREPTARPLGVGRELFGRRKDGTEIPLEIELNPLKISRGSFTLASIIDITGRKREAERFRRVVEAAPSAMIMIDGSGRIVLVNQRTEDLFGYARTEMLERPIELVIPSLRRGEHEGQVEGLLRERHTHGRRRDGQEMPIEVRLNPIETPDGPCTLASVVDITDRRLAEAAQEELAAIVAYSEDAIVSKTLDGVITSWNRGAQRLFGFSAEEAIGCSGAMLVPERLVDEDRRIAEQLRRSERLDPFETVRRCKDGTEVDVSMRLSLIRNAKGEIVGESNIARDITDLKRRDAELRRSNAELEQFAHVASHDLQEPLRMVANYTELLAERYRGQLDERAERYIHYASDGARRMQRLVTDLLSYSRVGTQGRPLVPVSSASVLDGVIQSLSALVQEAGATIESSVLPVVLADEVQLRQLFQNIIGNAIKFRASSPLRISIDAVADGRSWIFSVADTGIGLEMGYADRIFQMFQRLHELGKYEGSGIGLAIAKRIVERHGGRIWVDSKVSVGTTFFFTLRAAPSDP